MTNILLENFETVPFSKINNRDYLPAIVKLIQNTKEEIKYISSNKDDATFGNTIEALEGSGEKLNRASLIFSNINSAETNDEIQKIAQEIYPLLSGLENDINLNKNLFKRIKYIYEQGSKLNLSVEENTLLNKTYKKFSRNGANLNEEDKKKLRKIDAEIASLTLKFGQNLLAETNNYELHIENEDDLKGLPDGAKEAAEMLAKNKNKKGWLITLEYPSIMPILKYAENRNLRKEIMIANGSKCFKKNKYNNEDNILNISKLRYQRAKLLGYSNHAHFVLEERMAKNPNKVLTFLNELLQKAKPFAEQEIKQIEMFAKKTDGIDKIEAWDISFYSEKLRTKLFNLNDEKLKPYFKLENVLEGAFKVASKLFNLSFIEVHDIDTYHNEVKTFEVKNQKDELVAIFYADFHPRASKRGGAWMTSFRSQKIKNGINQRPHIANVCNFTKPTHSKPSLLTFNEVTTLFHEFGHGLHGMLANTKYGSLSGTNVHWDFVELPSQILENWCYEKECLDSFAKHYKTNKVIPIEYINKIRESSTFLEGMATLRQIRLGILDMAWHNIDPTNITNIKDYESNATKETQLLSDIKEICTSVSFGHIFSSPIGYSSGYYSYKWAEVLDADAFEYFKENGIFNSKIGKSFADNILSKGGTEDPMKLYKQFRGKEPNSEALLKRSGLAS